MSLSNEINNKFWTDPPWGDGHKKYRLGLKPIDLNKWLDRKPDQNLFNHKKELLKSNYSDVVATTNDSEDAQKKLGDILKISKTNKKHSKYYMFLIYSNL